MSLRIKLKKDKRKIDDRINIAIDFFNYFKDSIQNINLRIRDKGELIIFKEINSNNLSVEFIKNSLVNLKDPSIVFPFMFINKSAYLIINNEYNSKFAEDIEFDFFNESAMINLFLEKGLKSKFDSFLRMEYHDNKIVKCYADINEEGENNPLDIFYDYEPQGYNFFIRVMKALEVLADESPPLYDLYQKIKSQDKNYLASRLWSNKKINALIFSLAQSRGIIAQSGSMLIFAKNDEDIKNYYTEIIDKVLNPIFNDHPLIEEEIEKFSNTLPDVF